MSIALQNNLLKATEQKLEAGLTVANRKAYNKIVVAGMKIALDKGGEGMLAQLAKSQSPLEDAVHGAIGLCVLMRKQSRNTMPVQSMVPAGMTLLIHALDFLDKSGVMKIGQPEIVKATKMYANKILAAFGVDKKMIYTAAERLDKVASDPVNMEKMNQYGARKTAGTEAPNG
tara:strand:- start:184 stop:702 length:519 start_codon:yes stop_codon:yes gene_type:complete